MMVSVFNEASNWGMSSSHRCLRKADNIYPLSQGSISSSLQLCQDSNIHLCRRSNKFVSCIADG